MKYVGTCKCAINLAISFGLPSRGVVTKSVSFSSITTNLLISPTSMKPVALASKRYQILLNFSMFYLKISNPSSSLEFVNPFKMTAMNRLRKMIVTINSKNRKYMYAKLVPHPLGSPPLAWML